MTSRRWLIVGLSCGLLLALGAGGQAVVSGQATSQDVGDPPAVGVEKQAVSSAATEGGLIIDHTCTDLSEIPDHWIEQAKDLAIHYAHTSHGSQVRSNLDDLETQDALYDFSSFYAGSNPPTDLTGCETDAICMYDGNPPETYITPEDYWEGQPGIDRTEAVADTGLFDYSMWSWCGQASYYSDAQIQQYLDTMAQFEADYPDMRFILMTGHTDGGSADLARHNDMIRQYAVDHDMVLFDFADIETYDPLGGGPYDNNSEGTCTWCEDFCNNHPEYCTDLPSGCSHSASLPSATLFCKLKGNAFWWMMARLAGWTGPGETTKTASSSRPAFGDVVTYTITVQNLEAPLEATVYLTDVVPSGVGYISGTLEASAGVWDDGIWPTLTWTGVLSPTPVVTVTYVTTVTAAVPQAIQNTVTVTVPGYDAVMATRVIIANGHDVFLPLTLRQ